MKSSAQQAVGSVPAGPPPQLPSHPISVVQLSDMAAVAPCVQAFKEDVDGGENALGEKPAEKIPHGLEPQDIVPATVPAISMHHLPYESPFS